MRNQKIVDKITHVIGKHWAMYHDGPTLAEIVMLGELTQELAASTIVAMEREEMIMHRNGKYELTPGYVMQLEAE